MSWYLHQPESHQLSFNDHIKRHPGPKLRPKVNLSPLKFVILLLLLMLSMLMLLMLMNQEVDGSGYYDDVDDEDASMRQGGSADLTVESTCGRLTTPRWGRQGYDDDNFL